MSSQYDFLEHPMVSYLHAYVRGLPAADLRQALECRELSSSGEDLRTLRVRLLVSMVLMHYPGVPMPWWSPERITDAEALCVWLAAETRLDPAATTERRLDVARYDFVKDTMVSYLHAYVRHLPAADLRQALEVRELSSAGEDVRVLRSRFLVSMVLMHCPGIRMPWLSAERISDAEAVQVWQAAESWINSAERHDGMEKSTTRSLGTQTELRPARADGNEIGSTHSITGENVTSADDAKIDARLKYLQALKLWGVKFSGQPARDFLEDLRDFRRFSGIDDRALLDVLPCALDRDTKAWYRANNFTSWEAFEASFLEALRENDRPDSGVAPPVIYEPSPAVLRTALGTPMQASSSNLLFPGETRADNLCMAHRSKSYGISYIHCSTHPSQYTSSADEDRSELEYSSSQSSSISGYSSIGSQSSLANSASLSRANSHGDYVNSESRTDGLVQRQKYDATVRARVPYDTPNPCTCETCVLQQICDELIYLTR